MGITTDKHLISAGDTSKSSRLEAFGIVIPNATGLGYAINKHLISGGNTTKNSRIRAVEIAMLDVAEMVYNDRQTSDISPKYG